ncbi:MAG: hypothetical protein GY809_30880 [Planctomycetes bacterium]|nr:hypothetical protein [Planctomycetota bacterium]
MKTTRIGLMAVIVLSMAVTVEAEEAELGFVLDMTYMSKLMDKGGEYYGQQGGLLETVDFDLYDTGFGVAVGHRAATSSGYQAKERYDYKVHYGTSLFAGETFETQTAAAWIYHEHPNGGSQFNDFYEWELALAWPNLIPGGWVPGYKACGEHDLQTSFSHARWWHLFNLGKDVSLEQLSNPLKLYADVAYRDGLGGIREWTHATIGMSTDVALAENLSIVPGVYHQFSMSDQLTKDDVTYAVVSMQYRH